MAYKKVGCFRQIWYIVKYCLKNGIPRFKKGGGYDDKEQPLL